MNNLKDLANRAKNRLLNKGLRDTYSHANAIACNNMNMNFFNDKNKRDKTNESPFKYLLHEDEKMDIAPEAQERYLLNSIRKYLEEKNRLDKDAL